MTENQRQWLSVIVAIAAIIFGILLLGKPFWSLESVPVLLLFAVLFLLLWRGYVPHRARIGAVVIVVALGAIIARDISISLLVYGVIAWLLVRGVIAILSFRRAAWFTMVFGIAQVLLGLMAVYWLDVASIAIGLLVGPALIIVGAAAIIRTWQHHYSRGCSSSAGQAHTRGWIIAGRVGSLLILLVAVAATIATANAISKSPKLDDFADYSQPLGDQPGVLLRSEPFERGMPDGSSSIRILYTTTGLDGQVTLATGLVILPENAPSEPLPVVLWAHGTTGIEPECGPTVVDDPLGAGAMMFPEQPLDQGWAIVAPDYLGLGTTAPHPYLVGKPTAYSSLDAVRAARQLDSVSLSDQTVVWGHSQGGGAALWIGIEAPTYAPDVPLIGIAAMSPASDLPGFIDTAISTEAGPIFGGYVIVAYANTYDDIELQDYIRPGARFSQEKLVARCLSEPSIVVSVVSVLIREPFTHGNMDEGSLYSRLKENIPDTPMGVPLFLGQGEADPLIEPDVQANYVKDLCDAGQVVEYHTYSGLDHLGVVESGSPMIPDLMDWTIARFSGDPRQDSCSTVKH